jgi:hypothetical protein
MDDQQNQGQVVMRALLQIMLVIAAISPAQLSAFPRGDAHGNKSEPVMVMPLVESAVQQMTINKGFADAMLGPTTARFEVHVKKLAVDTVVIEIKNLSDQPLQLELFQVMADGRYSPSKSCPIAPGASSIEIWKEAFDALGFGRASLLAKDAALDCDKLK